MMKAQTGIGEWRPKWPSWLGRFELVEVKDAK